MMNDFVVAILAVLVLLSVCITKVASQVVSDSGGFFELDEAGCVIDTRTSDDEVLCDFFVQKVPESASETIAAAGFSITYHNTFKVITNNVASDKEVYVAYLCGTDKPGQSEFQENNLDIDEVNDIVKYVQIPVREYGINAQNILPFLQSAGAGDQWSLFPSRALIPTCANEGRAEGDEVSQILCGFDANCVGDAWEDSGIEVMFTDNFGLSDTPSGTGNEGVEYVSIKLSADDSAVSVSNFDKLGWLYFAAAFFNKELEVESEVHSLSQQFGCVNTFLENTASFNAEVVEDEDRLHVLVLSGYISSFGGFFIGSCPSYYCEFALNADPTVRSILLSDLPSLVGFGFTADQLINALTEANIRVDRVILNSYVERLAIHEDNGNEPGPEDDINNFEFTTLTDFLRDFRRGIETNPREIEFEAFFVPDTDAWFQVRPGVPHLVQQDFIQMLAKERLAEQSNDPSEFDENLYFYHKFPADAEIVLAAENRFQCEGFSEPIACTNFVVGEFQEPRTQLTCVAVVNDDNEGGAATAYSNTALLSVLAIVLVSLNF